MKRRNINILAVLFIFLIGFIIHNLYEWFPNIITLVISPVNESVFEHIKMIFSSYILWIIIKRYLYTKYNIPENNFILKEVLTALFNIGIFLLIFLPIYNAFGENLFITLFIYFISIVISQALNYFVKIKKESSILDIIGVLLIIVFYITTTYLTYNPIISEFFLDPKSNSYGLNK